MKYKLRSCEVTVKIRGAFIVMMFLCSEVYFFEVCIKFYRSFFIVLFRVPKLD